MNHETLEQHLAAKRWKEADELTGSTILARVDRQGYWLRKNDLLLLPAADMIIIDRLWRNYSRDRFGFSIQAQIWKAEQEEYKRTEIARILEKYGERYLRDYGWGTCKSWTWGNKFAKVMGWQFQEYEGRWSSDNKYEFQRNEKIPYDLNAPLGNLPSTYALGGGNSSHEYEPRDTESTMGFYGGDRWYYEWSRDSFVGYELLEKFYPLFEQWQEGVP
ncbi:GUN4 domain-containing protein [Oscillatoria sp. FACHB-1406]|uniref:GUN4 domain-containing protein n=1 Tax=Oscillatoria sp. FACHB-1406 TaxID=2692846 RepID=UPI001682952A|nr:GUN4 domain-containing protein [Oscillatoria sp. FACHB-1406]MBD2577665.1 GUN4 domain-containing protein [Oscillatoria sp. FACHB-1406]